MSINKEWAWLVPIFVIFGIIAIILSLVGHSLEYEYKDFNGKIGTADYCYQLINYKIMQCETEEGHKIMVQEYWIKNESEPNA